jgi:hypothetical protein
MAAEVVIDGVPYRIGELTAKQQFHVARRIAPLIAGLGEAAAAVPPATEEASDEDDADLTPEQRTQAQNARNIKALTPLFREIANSLHSLSDEDCDYVLRTCMGVVMRQQGDHWLPVWNKAADMPQFADVKLPALLQLSMAVLQENMGGFTLGLPVTGPPSAPTRQKGR